MNELQQQEFVAAVTEVQRDLYVFIVKMLPHCADADDLLQETNCLLWKKRHEFQPGTNFRAWAYKFAHLQVLAYRKSNQGRQLLLGSDFIDCVADEAAASPAASDVHRALRLCLQKLSSADQALLELRYTDSLLAPAIGARLSRTASSVRKSLLRVRRDLLRCVRRRMQQMEAP